MWGELATLGLWLAIATALIALGILGYAVRSTIQTSRITPKHRLVKRIQGQWRSSFLEDDAVAGRLIDLIKVPVVRQDFRLTLTIDGSPLQDLTDQADGETKISVTVATEFNFVNLGPKPIVMSLRQARPVGLMGCTNPQELTSLSIDGAPLATSGTADPEKLLDLALAPGAKRKMQIRSAYLGTLPYIAVFPQNIPVQGNSEVHLISRVRDRTALLVTGPNDCVRYDDDWWSSSDELEYRLRIINPLFPGDTILLTVGV